MSDASQVEYLAMSDKFYLTHDVGASDHGVVLTQSASERGCKVWDICPVRKPRWHLLTFFLHYKCNLLLACAWLASQQSGMVSYRYDHLARVLTKVLDERPDNAVDIIEDISRQAKQTKFTSHVDTIFDKVEPSAEVALAEIQMKLFAVSKPTSLV